MQRSRSLSLEGLGPAVVGPSPANVWLTDASSTSVEDDETMTTAGLLIFALGLLTLVMTKFLVPFLSRSYQARNPNEDPSRHDRFQRTYALASNSFFLVTGVILLVIGLLNGGSVGFDL